MVLPEGVLNTSNLQKVREYFEGRAKLILICSIPQDVFIAAGATVKPSLVFFKRFTEDEERQYAECKRKAYLKCYEPYKEEVEQLKHDHQALIDAGKSRSKEAKAIRSRLDAIASIVEEDSKPLVKEYFDYEIPIAKVEDAGITSTGSASAGNQLPALEKEYANYRIKHTLWTEKEKSISYRINSTGNIVRVVNGKEAVLDGDSE